MAQCISVSAFLNSQRPRNPSIRDSVKAKHKDHDEPLHTLGLCNPSYHTSILSIRTTPRLLLAVKQIEQTENRPPLIRLAHETRWSRRLSSTVR